MVTAAQCCERIQDKHKALVSAGSLKPLSQEAHVRDVLKVGFASRFLQTIRYFLWAKAPNTPQRCGGSFGLLGALAQTIAMALCLITSLGNSTNTDSICQAKVQSYPCKKQTKNFLRTSGMIKYIQSIGGAKFQ